MEEQTRKEKEKGDVEGKDEEIAENEIQNADIVDVRTKINDSPSGQKNSKVSVSVSVSISRNSHTSSSPAIKIIESNTPSISTSAPISLIIAEVEVAVGVRTGKMDASSSTYTLRSLRESGYTAERIRSEILGLK